MKKLLVLSVLFTLLSCSTGSNNSVNSTSNDSINADTVVVYNTIEVDSTPD